MSLTLFNKPSKFLYVLIVLFGHNCFLCFLCLARKLLDNPWSCFASVKFNLNSLMFKVTAMLPWVTETCIVFTRKRQLQLRVPLLLHKMLLAHREKNNKCSLEKITTHNQIYAFFLRQGKNLKKNWPFFYFKLQSIYIQAILTCSFNALVLFVNKSEALFLGFRSKKYVFFCFSIWYQNGDIAP